MRRLAMPTSLELLDLLGKPEILRAPKPVPRKDKDPTATWPYEELVLFIPHLTESGAPAWTLQQE
jgi:hypothetical protein